jgi:hypothetical protein
MVYCGLAAKVDIPIQRTRSVKLSPSRFRSRSSSTVYCIAFAQAQKRQVERPVRNWRSESCDYSKTFKCRTKVQFALPFTWFPKQRPGTTLTGHFLKIIIVFDWYFRAYTCAVRKPGHIVKLYLAGKSL